MRGREAGLYGSRPRGGQRELHGALHRLLRTAGLVALTAVFAACVRVGLSSSEWIWCKENAPAVDVAATP